MSTVVPACVRSCVRTEDLWTNPPMICSSIKWTQYWGVILENNINFKMFPAHLIVTSEGLPMSYLPVHHYLLGMIFKNIQFVLFCVSFKVLWGQITNRIFWVFVAFHHKIILSSYPQHSSPQCFMVFYMFLVLTRTVHWISNTAWAFFSNIFNLHQCVRSLQINEF